MKKLSMREDWPYIGFVLFFFTGLIVAIIDLIVLQHLQFQFNAFFYIGIVLFLIGGIIEMKIRLTLAHAG